MNITRLLCAGDELGRDLYNTVYALDASTIDYFCVYPRSRFRSKKYVVKINTLIDLRGIILSFIRIYDGNCMTSMPLICFFQKLALFMI